MNKNQSEPKHFGAFYLWLNEEIDHDEKVTLTPE